LAQWSEIILRLEAVGDLVGDYDGNVVSSCQVAEVSAELSDLGAAFGKGMRWFASFFKLGAVVGGNTVYYYEADVEAFDRDWDLETQDMLLSFEVVDVSALDAGQTGFLVGG
jgi:hypothetical protein